MSCFCENGSPTAISTGRFAHPVSVLFLLNRTLSPVLVKKYCLLREVLFRTIYEAHTITDFVSPSNKYFNHEHIQ